MLAAIALLTGGFLVFSTQLLSVARRRREFALLRALGLVRAELMRGLLAEGRGGGRGRRAGRGCARPCARRRSLPPGGGRSWRGLLPRRGARSWRSTPRRAWPTCCSASSPVSPAPGCRRALRLRWRRRAALRAGEGERAGLPRGDGRGRLAAAMLVLAVLACLVPPLGGIPVGGYAAVVFVLAAAILALPGARARPAAACSRAGAVRPGGWRTPAWRRRRGRRWWRGRG